jgi:hypothetical protein
MALNDLAKQAAPSAWIWQLQRIRLVNVPFSSAPAIAFAPESPMSLLLLKSKVSTLPVSFSVLLSDASARPNVAAPSSDI